MDKEKVYVGIDVAKATLDVVVHSSGQRWSFTNDDNGISEAITCLREVAPELVVLEANGGFELPLTAALVAAGVPTVVVNPRQVRDFAKATGRLAKADTLDAQVIAHFAAVRPTPCSLPSTQAQEFSAILTRRRQLVEMLTAERNRLSTARESVRGRIQAHITWSYATPEVLGPRH